ncbi:dihydrolipoamide acetyltransferase family protein [Nocardioides sp. YIM 152315]|uniref:dihydrolipoamide acetyltransferase family protein n=1 Tax=Nocardioides sp. YIM 152315 TaxID=3031760 RepID=UPI0023DC2766|nr:dihydrolipoamide acetyltransferase family protein [Nocardioides sp. YIM 152315]
MPEVAANATDAVLAEWLVAESAEVTVGDALATVETDKALVDVEADADGVVLKVLVAAGTRVEVGSPIAVLGAAGEEYDPSLVEAPTTAPPATNGATRVFASPLARKLAKDGGLAIEDLVGTGPRGRILRRDVDKALASPVVEEGAGTPSPVVEEGAGTPPSVVEEGALAPVSKPPSAEGAVPHTRRRRAIASRLTESKQTAPHFYARATVRADALVALRAEINAGEVKVSLNDLVVKAVAAAHRAVPEMNVVWMPDAVRTFDTVDVAVAVATDRGLVTPVLRDVTALPVSTVAERVRDLAGRARDGRLRQDELEGGTISVTNLGMYGVEEFAAIINPPHAAILAVGAVRDEPVVEDGAVVPGRLMTVTLSVDHRPVDGVVAARWLAVLKDLLEHPVRILA